MFEVKKPIKLPWFPFWILSTLGGSNIDLMMLRNTWVFLCFLVLCTTWLECGIIFNRNGQVSAETSDASIENRRENRGRRARVRTQWHWLRIGYPLPSTKDICYFLCLLGVRGLKGHRSQRAIDLFVSRSYSTEQMNSMLALSLYAYKTLSTVCLSDVTNYRTICLPPMSLTEKPVYIFNHSSPLTLARSHNLEPITRRFLK